MPLVRAARAGGRAAARSIAPSAYIGLWTRLERFDLDQLTRALERKRVIQGTLMRFYPTTSSLCGAGSYRPFLDGLGPSREAWPRRSHGLTLLATSTPCASGSALSSPSRLAPKELDELLRTHGSTFWQGVWVELIRAPLSVPGSGGAPISFSWPRNGWGDERPARRRVPPALPLPRSSGRLRRRRTGPAYRGDDMSKTDAAALSQRGGQGAAPSPAAHRCQMPAPGHRFASSQCGTPRSSCFSPGR